MVSTTVEEWANPGKNIAHLIENYRVLLSYTQLSKNLVHECKLKLG